MSKRDKCCDHCPRVELVDGKLFRTVFGNELFLCPECWAAADARKSKSLEETERLDRTEALEKPPTAEELEEALEIAHLELRRRHSGARGQQLYMEDGHDYQLIAAFLRVRARAWRRNTP